MSFIKCNINEFNTLNIRHIKKLKLLFCMARKLLYIFSER
ncbi:protein of unknown function [Clostridium beijerinckii]|nr:protein of unknown function [Clostridium beijerinckii]